MARKTKSGRHQLNLYDELKDILDEYSQELYENKELKLLYDMLVKYIKKTYEYNREMSAYIAPHFMERLKRGEVIPCNSDNPYKLLGQ